MKLTTIMPLLPLLIGSPHPYNSFNFGTTYTRNLYEHYQKTSTYGKSMADYWSIGPNTNNTIGGPTQRTQIISHFSYSNATLSNKIEEALLKVLIYTEVQTNGYIYTGNYSWTSQIQLDPAFYDYVTLQKTDVYWDYNYNLTTFHNLVFNTYTDVTSTSQQIASIIAEVANEGGSHNTVSHTFQDIISNGNGTKAFNESGTTPNSYAWLTYVELRQLKTNDPTDMTEQQIYTYYHALDSYIQEVTFNLDIEGTAPTPTPGTNYEVIDLPGLMFTVLGMPFAWISTAFDLTLFPGTPYSINIAHIFMAVIAVSIFIFIIKKVIR